MQLYYSTHWWQNPSQDFVIFPVLYDLLKYRNRRISCHSRLRNIYIESTSTSHDLQMLKWSKMRCWVINTCGFFFVSFSIMRSCWHPNPKGRPTFEKLVQLTDSLLTTEAVSNMTSVIVCANEGLDTLICFQYLRRCKDRDPGLICCCILADLACHSSSSCKSLCF